MAHLHTAPGPAICAAVIVGDGCVLLVRRRVAEGSLSWQFPAGTMEPGESPEDTAVREAYEETGLTTRAVARLGSRVHPDTGRTVFYVVCEAVSGQTLVADEDEIAEVDWCDRQTVAARISTPLFGPVQKHLEAVLV